MENKLDDRVKHWIESEGFPLEFFTAHQFKKRRFSVDQSYFTRDKSGKTREVDVIATANVPYGRSFLRIKHVVECKWSQEKPWVFFRDGKRFVTSALVAQLISSSAAQALTWAAAGRKEFQDLEFFKETGFTFSGRQAFSKGNDLFYQSVQGVVSNCLNIVSSYDEYEYPPNESILAVIALPMIVVDGSLFEATYDAEGNELKLDSIKHTRLRWKGNEGRKVNTIIDIVAADYLDTFLEIRQKEIEVMINCFGESLEQLIRCFEEKTEKHLVISQGPRGILGLPKLLKQLKEVSASAVEKP